LRENRSVHKVLAEKKLTDTWRGKGVFEKPSCDWPLPSFFIVGPPRTGTSWLHEIFKNHAVLPKTTKETRFFDTHFHRGIEWYAAHFPNSTGRLQTGEIAPTYFVSADARQRIFSWVPDARIVCVFRNPVDRVISLYRVKRAYGMIPWSFEEAMVRDPELVESSRYAAHLREWQQTFGMENVLPMLYDDLREQPQQFVNRLADFVAIPRFTLAHWQIGRIHGSDRMTQPRSYYRTRGATALADWFKAQRLDRVVAAVKTSPLIRLFLGGGPPFAETSEEVLRSLYELFRPEVEQLECMLNRNLAAWKDIDVAMKATPAAI
jgi:hypothetical protein